MAIIAPINEPEQQPDNPNGQFAPNAFIRIDNAGKTTLVIPQAERSGVHGDAMISLRN